MTKSCKHKFYISYIEHKDTSNVRSSRLQRAYVSSQWSVLGKEGLQPKALRSESRLLLETSRYISRLLSETRYPMALMRFPTVVEKDII